MVQHSAKRSQTTGCKTRINDTLTWQSSHEQPQHSWQQHATWQPNSLAQAMEPACTMLDWRPICSRSSENMLLLMTKGFIIAKSEWSQISLPKSASGFCWHEAYVLRRKYTGERCSINVCIVPWKLVWTIVTHTAPNTLLQSTLCQKKVCCANGPTSPLY